MSFLSGPSVETIRSRRWVVFVTSIIWNGLFAAPLFGWASLRQMLMDFGWKSDACMEQCKSYDAVNWELDYKTGLNGSALIEYESLTGSAKSAQWNPNGCNTAYFKNYTVSEWYDESSGLDRTAENEWVMGCNAQNEVLNRYFTIGTSCLSGSTMLYGLIMDKYGRRWLRIAGTLAFAISCVLFSLASIQPRELGWIVLPAVLCNGMGGILYIFTGFELANLFPGGRSTVCALLIGSYNASALVYPILYEFYTKGLSFIGCMTIHGVIALITFVESWINTPSESIPEPGSENKEDEDDKKEKSEDEEIPSFMSVLFSIPCILSLVTMCITVLRLSMYIGQMSIWFTNAAKLQDPPITDEQEIKMIVEDNARTFGFIQILCVVWAVPIGYVLDRKLDQCKKNPSKANPATSRTEEVPFLESKDENNGQTYERVQKLRNTRDAYFITVGCLLIFGALIIMQANIKIQIITFILHTVIRTFIHSSAAGIYVNVFHMSHIGKLTGLGSIAGAIFSLIMDPLMKLVQGPLEGNPYWLNVALLFASLFGGLLPCYLHWFANKTEAEYRKVEERGNKKSYETS